jgi:type I restriction enzyme S subunit
MIQSVKLSKLCIMRSGGTPSRSNLEYYEGDFPWAKISDLEKSDDGYIYKTQEHITQEALKSINNRQFIPGTLLLAMYGSVGKTAITKINLTTNQAILGINILDDTILDIKYLKYWFSTIKKRLLDRAVGAALPNISLGIVKELKIPLPPLEQQKKIAAILDAADTYRQKTKALITKYDALTQSLFLDMFGDPVRNPKGWNYKNLDESLEFLTSGSRGWAKYYSDEGTVFLRIQNVGYNELRLDDLTYVRAPDSAENKRTKVKAGDLLLTITADLGRTAVIPDNFPDANINQHLALLRLKDTYNPLFVSSYIASHGGQSLFLKLDKGGVKAGLNFKDLKSYKVFDVPRVNQDKFEYKIKAIETQKAQAEASLVQAENLFNSLLQRAFKGELTTIPENINTLN